MEKVFEAVVSSNEAARLLKVFADRAYVYVDPEGMFASRPSVYAETLRGRKMVLSWSKHRGWMELYLHVNEDLYKSETFWSESFAGLDKDRFTGHDVVFEDYVFDTTYEAVCVGCTPPESYGTEDWKESDYASLCEFMGVTPINLETEVSEEMKALEPLLAGLSHVNNYELECIARLVCGRIDRDDLDARSLRKARIESVINRLKWEVLGHFEQEVSGRFPLPPLNEEEKVSDEAVPQDQKKPRRKPVAKKPAAKKQTVDA